MTILIACLSILAFLWTVSAIIFLIEVFNTPDEEKYYWPD